MTAAAATKSLLVIGGARSGKSRYAQQFADASGFEPWLIATAESHDEEMRARIARHAAERGPRWRLIEEPLALAAALTRACRPGRLVLVDCATLWLSNLMLRGQDADAAADALAACVGELAGPVIFVSNEVGAGIVPDNALARAFRDAQGALNQKLARACDAVVQVCAGLPTQLKPRPAPALRF